MNISIANILSGKVEIRVTASLEEVEILDRGWPRLDPFARAKLEKRNKEEVTFDSLKTMLRLSLSDSKMYCKALKDREVETINDHTKTSL